MDPYVDEGTFLDPHSGLSWSRICSKTSVEMGSQLLVINWYGPLLGLKRVSVKWVRERTMDSVDGLTVLTVSLPT